MRRRLSLLVGLAVLVGIALNFDAVLRSAASFPTAIKSFTTKNSGDKVQAAHVNDLQDEVTALEQDLINGMSRVRLSSSTLTLASDAVTATKSLHAVDTEAAAATDNLSTISAGSGVGSGHLLTLYAANVARVVTVKDATGNIQLAGGDFALDTAKKSLLLRYDGTNWVEVSRASASFNNGLNTFGAAATLGLTDAFELGFKTNNIKALDIDSTQFIDSPTQPRAGVFHGTTQSIPNTTDTALLFNSEDFDVGTLHDTVTNNSRITIPTGGDGLYLVTATYCPVSAAAGSGYVFIKKNGATTVSTVSRSNLVNGNTTGIQVVALVVLAAADYIEAIGNQSSGGALLSGDAAQRMFQNQFQAVKIW